MQQAYRVRRQPLSRLKPNCFNLERGVCRCELECVLRCVLVFRVARVGVYVCVLHKIECLYGALSVGVSSFLLLFARWKWPNRIKSVVKSRFMEESGYVSCVD